MDFIGFVLVWELGGRVTLLKDHKVLRPIHLLMLDEPPSSWELIGKVE